MRTQYLAAIVTGALVAGTGLAVRSVQNQTVDCRRFPSACQTSDTANGSVTPTRQPAAPATRLAVRLAESVDSFLARSSG
jgi:hypothetical protein